MVVMLVGSMGTPVTSTPGAAAQRLSIGTGSIGIPGFEPEHPAVKVELGLERPPDVRRLAEAVLLALEGQVGDRHALGPQGVDDHLGLRRRHDLVLEALQHDERAVEPVDVVDRRALDVALALLGVGPDERVEVAGLELVGVAGQGLEVGDAVEAGAGGEGSWKVRAHSVVKPPALPPRMASRSGSTRPSAGEVLGHGDAVVDVDDAPLRRRAASR